MSRSTNSQSQDDTSLSDRADNWFQKVVPAFFLVVIVVVPVLLWLANKLLGWQPPDAIMNLLKSLSS